MALKAINKVLLKIFCSRNERLIKSYAGFVERTGALEETVKQLDDAALTAKTVEFKAALEAGTKAESILPEAFAVVREVAWRNLQMRHFDVQLIGGNVLFEGKIAEMATGEGKTLAATLAAYMVYLTGRHVHVITVNDYLAKRDAEWMTPVYNALGMTVGAIQADMDTAGQERKETPEDCLRLALACGADAVTRAQPAEADRSRAGSCRDPCRSTPPHPPSPPRPSPASARSAGNAPRRSCPRSRGRGPRWRSA